MTDSAPLTFTDNPTNPLEELLYAGLADAGQMGNFERAMLEADLYAVPEPGSPGGTPGDDGARVLRPGEQLILRGVVLNDGRNTVTLFTDPRRATKMFGDDARILAMQGRKLLDMLKDVVILLNPEGGRGLKMEPDQIRQVLEHAPVGISTRRPSGPVELVEPPEAYHPLSLMGRLDVVFREMKVDEAWLARARWSEARMMGWFLDIRTDAPADEVVALCERAVRGLPFGGEVFDVAVSKPGGEKGVGVKLA
ncbi:SseB family protein [Brevundimonas sp.]|uniref:SseB family protein n=1 Tax=Brevundimonas sp. TaxID=1871086 RepID=UPI002737E91B|nr:SseB family protein [Brevundimonas sp.]MDP3803407.1 SseB family protein [Brevundimonas sp.]